MIRPGALLPHALDREATVRRDTLMAAAGGVALLPALVLVTTGVAGLNAPAFLVHPAWVMGGLCIALVTSLVSATRWELRKEGDGIRFCCTIRYRVANLVVLAMGLSLLAIITVYLFRENFQPRLLG